MPEHRIIRRVHDWSMTKGRSWERKMLQFIDTAGMSEYMLCDGPTKSLCISLARDFLIECDNAKWYQQLMNDGNVEMVIN